MIPLLAPVAFIHSEHREAGGWLAAPLTVDPLQHWFAFRRIHQERVNTRL